jgi:hypothetical protein
MGRHLRQREYLELSKQVLRPAFQALLTQAQAVDLVASRYATWLELAGAPERFQDDALLRILEAHGSSESSRWRTILLLIFWTNLEALASAKRFWDPDPDELWSNLRSIFLQVLCRYEPARRPHNIAQKINLDTFHHLYQHYKREWPWTRSLRLDDDKSETPQIAGAARGIDDVEASLDRQWRLRHLRSLRNRGVLTETNYLLLVGTEVYGRTLSDMAAQLGLAYEAAKKRRLRACDCISAYRSNLENLDL